MSLQNAISAIAAEKHVAAKKGGKSISAAERKKTATVKGGKFPIPDKKHARLALAFENRAKPPLTASQKATVTAKANSMLGKS